MGVDSWPPYSHYAGIQPQDLPGATLALFAMKNMCVSLFQPALNMETVNLKFYPPLPPSAPESEPHILAFTAHISYPKHPFHILTRWQYRSCTA